MAINFKSSCHPLIESLDCLQGLVPGTILSPGNRFTTEGPFVFETQCYSLRHSDNQTIDTFLLFFFFFLITKGYCFSIPLSKRRESHTSPSLACLSYFCCVQKGCTGLGRLTLHLWRDALQWNKIRSDESLSPRQS